MGKKTSGIYADTNGLWQVDKWSFGLRIRQPSALTITDPPVLVEI
jgi:hypothetical protein